MPEASQSAMRIISLVAFLAMFVGLWANDRPSEIMAQKEMPQPEAFVETEQSDVQTAVESSCQIEEATIAAQSDESSPAVSAGTEVTPVNAASETVSSPVLEPIRSDAVGMVMTIAVETEGLAMMDSDVQKHLRQLPLGVANGDYLMVDPQGGVGWLRIRGQQQVDGGETALKTSIAGDEVHYIRVSPVNAVMAKEPNAKILR